MINLDFGEVLKGALVLIVIVVLIMIVLPYFSGRRRR
jgi:hypothetical protein